MPLAAHVAALLEALSPADMTALPPAERRRFAAVARRVADMAETPVPRSGVLAELRNGRMD
jgi:hypothetical protein